MKKYLTFIALAISGLLSAQYTDIINSNLPGKSIGAYALGRKTAQLESDFFIQKKQHQLLKTQQHSLGVEYQLRWGVWSERLEAILDGMFISNENLFPFKQYHQSGFQHNTIGVKYLIYNPLFYEKTNVYSWRANYKFQWRKLIPAVSIYLGANLFSKPLSLELHHKKTLPNISPKTIISLQSHPMEGTVLVMNFIGDELNSSERTLSYIATIVQHISQTRWSIFAEFQAIKSPYYGDALYRAGVTFLVNKNLQINSSIGGSWKNTPRKETFSIGISYRFYDQHKKVELINKLKARNKEQYQWKK